MLYIKSYSLVEIKNSDDKISAAVTVYKFITINLQSLDSQTPLLDVF